MREDDIPQVLEIERQSFPRIWPQTLYQRELKNKMARYLVAYEPLDEDACAEKTAGEAWLRRGVGGLLRRFFGSPPQPPHERILGLVGLWYAIGEAHIVTIAVRQEHRRQGIGELLLVLALEAALEAGQNEVTLEYRISSHAARSLYEKYGFRRVGVRPRYYSDNQEDAVLMTTPPLRSPEFRQLLAQRIADQRARWGDDYPLAGREAPLAEATPPG
ncbi:MAG: ribosomal-protein-alanine N-acetyltransferase [Chloroflexi bacterium RBG_16_68_14]|nr:MAG: ribosomal-protein-alanine N-acetyltransferase [Chloroflexi bacterium RBG_16_68_14]